MPLFVCCPRSGTNAVAVLLFLLWARRPVFPRSEQSLCGVRRQMVCLLSVLRVDLVSCLWPEQFAERGLADYV